MTSGEALATIGRGVLPAIQFQKVLDLNPQIRHIELSNYGEVFLNPELRAILRYAHENHVALSIQNGANLNSVPGAMLEAVVRYRLRVLRCSIDGATQATYARYRVGGSFEKVIENIEAINRFKLKYKSEYPKMVWQFIVFGHNQGEIGAARDQARRLGMDFSLKLSWDDNLSPVTENEALRDLMGAISRKEYQLNHGAAYMHGICHQLWDSPQINWNGDVLGCSRNFWRTFGGNAFRDGLLKSLNEETITYAREMLQGRQPARQDIPCNTCDIYHAMKENGKWLSHDAPRALPHFKSLVRHYLPASFRRFEFSRRRL